MVWYNQPRSRHGSGEDCIMKRREQYNLEKGGKLEHMAKRRLDRKQKRKLTKKKEWCTVLVEKNVGKYTWQKPNSQWKKSRK